MTKGPGRRPGVRTTALRAGGVALLLLTLGVWVARLELGRDLSALRLGVLSGSAEGNYHRIVERFGEAAARRQGRLDNLGSEGSVANVARLEAAQADGSCSAAFALVQDGQDWPKAPPLQLLGKLPRAESVLFLGKKAGELGEFATLRGLRIGIGPEGSGTAKVARQILESRGFEALGLTLEPHPLQEQLALAASGGLDLAVLVIDEDAALVDAAVREQGLQIASFTQAEGLVGRVPHVHVGRIPAGHYDPVRLLPARDLTVLQLDTLLVGNGCAGRSRTVAFLTVVAEVFPELVRTNQGRANTTGLALAPAAKSFYENDGPELFDQYAPWLVDIMPPGKWVYVVTAVSVLFNLMGFGHRFQLWRIDTGRVRVEQKLAVVFGPGTTIGEIRALAAAKEAPSAALVEGAGRLILELEALSARSRRMSLSFLVPMGQEMGYRIQEEAITELLAALRELVRHAGPPAGAA